MARSSSGTEFFPGQREQIGGKIFSPGGVFSQLLKGKPDAGFDRAQVNALAQLRDSQAQAGTLNTPLGTRMQSDFLQGSTQKAGDNFFQRIAGFMQPAGSQQKGAAGLLGGKG